MKYNYLATWAEENSVQKLVFKKLERYEDQYRMIFRKQRDFLQVNLASEDSFCFFSEEHFLPWREANDLGVTATHLGSARLIEINISKQDRIIHLNFEKIDIYNQKQTYTLIIELIPRYQNIILIDENRVIIDCKKKISFAENRHRQILPGVEYCAPDVEYENAHDPVKFPLKRDGKKIIESVELGFEKINPIFSEIYYQEIFHQRNERKRANAIKIVDKQIKKRNRKVEKMEVELSAAEMEEEWKQKAELLKGNYTLLKTGMEKIEVVDYYQEDFPEIEIPILAKLSPQKNIDRYFKKYRKARDGKKIIKQQIDKCFLEVDQLQKERFDLEEQEFFFGEKSVSASKQSGKRNYKKILIDEEWEIFIGRTSTENDFLTTRMAKSDDWWFHTRIFRGTHVILRNYKKQDLPEALKQICCRIASYYSKAKKSTNVPVDYTQIRHVRKPRGSAPGYVVYKNQKTLYVDPLSMRDAIKELKNWR